MADLAIFFRGDIFVAGYDIKVAGKITFKPQTNAEYRRQTVPSGLDGAV